MKTLVVALSFCWLPSWAIMFLRCTKRLKDGKEHLYWSIVESRRVSPRQVVQRHVLYLGELNGRQEASWRKTIELFGQDEGAPQQVALFAEEHAPKHVGVDEFPVVQLRLHAMRLERPRQWGACWLACQLWEQLLLADFWQERLPPSREGTRWDLVLQTLVLYRLIEPGSEWRLHRHWFDQTAIADLLDADFVLAEIHRLYECHDKILAHKRSLFDHLTQRWRDLFGVRYEVLLYDLTSTYFECAPPDNPTGLRRFGYSRDKRSDCVQVVIALIVTPEGFPLAYEVLPGNTADKTTLKAFLAKIEDQYGQADRIWVMDRGIPTEETLEQMRQSTPPVSYLVGTPKGRLSKLEESLAQQPWQQARPQVRVKLLPHEGETYVLAQSEDRVAKERSMRRRRLRKYLDALQGLRQRKRPLTRDAMHEALGAAKKEAGRDARFVKVSVQLQPAKEEGKAKAKAKAKGKSKQLATLSWQLDRKTLREAWRREGRYLLRTNLTATDPARLWEYYLQLVEVEQAFKELKHDLGIRPVHHQHDHRIEAHIFVSFLAYCLQVTLKARLKLTASGLTPRSVLEKFATVQMLDVHLPTTDGREVVMSRYTQPSKEMQLLLDQLKMTLPEQAPPKITG
nr:IS1634-like element ISVsp2 family transposase [Verrucomicrobium spinosum]